MARQVIIQVEVDGKPFAPDNDFLRFSLTQQLGGHHSFELILPYDRAEDSKSAFFTRTLDQLLGKPVTISVTEYEPYYGKDASQPLQFKGVVTGLSTSKNTDYSATITVLGSGLCRQLDDGLQKRTFVKQTLATIFQQVLAPYSENMLPRRIKPAHTAPLPYVVQYQESNYAFLSRLAAEYGEWFYYDGQVLCLGLPTGGKMFDFVADGIYNTFHFNLTLQPTQSTLYDYNYEQHERYTSNTSPQQVPALSQQRYNRLAFERAEKLFAQASYTAPGMEIRGDRQLTEEAKFLKASRVANLVMLQGQSDRTALLLGRGLNVQGEGLGTENLTDENFGTYRITRLTHHVNAAGKYSNTFTAIPYLLEVPPAFPAASVNGTPELAEVIDKKDPQQLGRVRVRYYWQVVRPQDAETDWLRVLTPYAGAGKGQLFTPEVGSQVLIGYAGGLAEQPYVQGNLFHARNKAGATYTHNGGDIKGIQTLAGNRITLHDKKDEEKIVITNGNQKETAIEISFKGKGRIEIKTSGDLSLSAGQNISIEAGKSLTIKAEELTTETAQATEIKASTKLTVAGSRGISVLGN